MAERRKEKKERRRTMTLPYWQKGRLIWWRQVPSRDGTREKENFTCLSFLMLERTSCESVYQMRLTTPCWALYRQWTVMDKTFQPLLNRLYQYYYFYFYQFKLYL